MTPWDVLEIKPGSSKDEIRKAFRAKIKKVHPDKATPTEHSAQEAARLIEAYKVLLSDSLYFTSERTYKEFNYREFLLERNDNRSKAKLVLYDLLKNREDEAIALYLDTELLCPGFILKYLDRDDSLDAIYLLANAFRERRDFWRSLDLLILLGEEEVRKPFFRLFYIEIQYIIRLILTQDVADIWDSAERIFQIKRALPLITDPYERSRLMETVVKIYLEAGQYQTVESWLSRMMETYPEDRFVKALIKQALKKNKRVDAPGG